MRLKLTLLLLLLNAALFTTLYYLERHADARRSFDEQSSLVLPSGAVEEADAIELSGPGVRQGWRIERKQAGWLVDEPVQWPANHFAVESILNQLRFMRWETRFPVEDVERSGRTLADYGLDNPPVVLTLRHGERATELRMGAATQIGNRLYLLSPDSGEVLVVPRDVLRSVLLGIDDLRSSNVFEMPASQVRSLAVQREGGVRARLIRRDAGWEFESPIRVAANDAAVESLFAELLSIQVQRFIQPDLAQQGLLSPRARVTVEGTNTRQTLLVGGPGTLPGRVFAKLEDSPEVFSIDALTLDRLLNVQEALRERSINRFDSTAITEVAIAAGEQSALLQKLETGEWQVLRGGDDGRMETWRADATVVRRLLEQLDGLRALRFVSDAPSSADLATFGLVNPQRRVTMKIGAQTRVLLLGDSVAEPRSVYARIEGEPFVYEVPGEILNVLRPVPLHYRSREFDSLPAAARIGSIRLTDLADGAPLLDLEAGPDGWTPLVKTLDEEKAKALLGLVGFIRAGRARDFVARQFADPMPLDDQDSLPWRFRLDAVVALPAGAGATTRRDISYVFTERVGGTTQFGGSQAHNLVFTLPQDLIDALAVVTPARPEPGLEQLPPPAALEGAAADAQPAR